MPLIVPWIQRAPARTAATADAVASPKSLWPWKCTGTSRPDPLDGLADELRDGLRGRDAERVDDDDLARARLDGGLVHALVEVGLRARRVDAEERGEDAVLAPRSASRS